jgi:hypothetical protein
VDRLTGKIPLGLESKIGYKNNMNYRVTMKRKVLQAIGKRPRAEQKKLALAGGRPERSRPGSTGMAQFQQTVRRKISLPSQPEMGCLLAAREKINRD